MNGVSVAIHSEPRIHPIELMGDQIGKFILLLLFEILFGFLFIDLSGF